MVTVAYCIEPDFLVPFLFFLLRQMLSETFRVQVSTSVEVLDMSWTVSWYQQPGGWFGHGLGAVPEMGVAYIMYRVELSNQTCVCSVTIIFDKTIMQGLSTFIQDLC